MVVITAITTPIMIVIMALQGAPLRSSSATPLGILDLEFAGKVERAGEIYKAWQPSIVPVAINNTLIDFLFILSYGSFLYACCLMLSKYYVEGWRKTGLWAGRLILVAALFDAVENILMFRTLGGSIYKEIVASTFMLASAKFLLVIFSIFYIFGSLLGLLFRRRVGGAKPVLN